MLFVCRQAKEEESNTSELIKNHYRGDNLKRMAQQQRRPDCCRLCDDGLYFRPFKMAFLFPAVIHLKFDTKNCNRHQTPAQPAAKRFQQLHTKKVFYDEEYPSKLQILFFLFLQ